MDGTIFANAQPGIVVCEVLIKGKGQFRDTVSTTHPILGWLAVETALMPLTLARPKPDALRLIFDTINKRYLSLSGEPFKDFQEAVASLWATSDALQESQEP